MTLDNDWTFSFVCLGFSTLGQQHDKKVGENDKQQKTIVVYGQEKQQLLNISRMLVGMCQ